MEISPAPQNLIPLQWFGLDLANGLAKLGAMIIVTVHKAKTELSKLLKRVEAGEEIIIARGDKPIAKLTSAEPVSRKPRKPGAWKGKFALPDNVFEPLSEEELALWEGAGEGPL